MGSVSMQSQASSRGERLSAFVDGELFGEEHLNKFIWNWITKIVRPGRITT